MNARQETALKHHCRLAGETVHPRFAELRKDGISLILTVNSGYE